MLFRVGLLLAIFLSCIIARPADGTAHLDESVKARIGGFKGRVSLYVKNLESGASYGLAANDPVRTASTTKLAIMVECFAEAAEGKLRFSEAIQIPADEKVSGSGIVQDLSVAELPARDLIELMIVLSDNTATNLILNRIGGNAVNARMASLGLTQTRVMRKILGDRQDLKPQPSGVTEEGAKAENKKWGIGRSSPAEMVMLLEKIYRGALVSKEASDEMLKILKQQRDHECLGRDMKDVKIASKSGSLDNLRSDVGIIYSKRGPIAMAATVDGMPEPNWTPDNRGSLLIAALSEIVVDALGANR